MLYKVLELKLKVMLYMGLWVLLLLVGLCWFLLFSICRPWLGGAFLVVMALYASCLRAPRGVVLNSCL